MTADIVELGFAGSVTVEIRLLDMGTYEAFGCDVSGGETTRDRVAVDNEP